jgi:enoyl-CoA hydratase
MNGKPMNDIKREISDRIATITIDRAPVNALTGDTYMELRDLFSSIGQNREVQCVILTAAGQRAFSAGKDLHEFLAARIEDDPDAAAVIHATFKAIYECEVPVIAAVNGPALGAGAVIASCCDIRIASTTATFALPEINVGRCGGGAHLGRLIPQGALRRMFFTGKPISAVEAYRIGLVDELAEPTELAAAARALAESIAAKSPLGLRIGKRALNATEVLPLFEAYSVEQRASTELMATHDAREATLAIVEKRAPRFTGS